MNNEANSGALRPSTSLIPKNCERSSPNLAKRGVSGQYKRTSKVVDKALQGVVLI